jgi:hypothetical protein
VSLLALVVTLGACSQPEPVARTVAPAGNSTSVNSPSPSPSRAVEPETPTAPLGDEGTKVDKAPEPGSMARPDTSAGPLDQDDFPRPGALGPRWEYSIDPGNAEEGYAGNGTPALARKPAEVVRLAVPLGCPRPDRMPVPDHALEVDYTVDATKVVAIRSEFEDAATARQFFAARNANVRRCVGRSGGQAVGPIISTTETVADDVLLSDRTPESAPWAEMVLLDDDQVVLVAAQTRLGSSPMTTAEARRLAKVFRR